MYQKIYFPFLLISLTLVTFSCQPEPEITTSGDIAAVPLTIKLLIENHTSSDKEVEFNKTALVFRVLGYTPDPLQWLIDEQVFEEESFPRNIVLSANDTTEITLKDGATLHPDLHWVLSFILKIDGKQYAGWSSEYERYSDMPSAENGLGYLVVKTSGEMLEPVKINGQYFSAGPKKVEISSLISNLTPMDIEEELSGLGVEATYRVMITDEGVTFVLEKLIQRVPIVAPIE